MRVNDGMMKWALGGGGPGQRRPPLALLLLPNPQAHLERPGVRVQG